MWLNEYRVQRWGVGAVYRSYIPRIKNPNYLGPVAPHISTRIPEGRSLTGRRLCGESDKAAFGAIFCDNTGPIVDSNVPRRKPMIGGRK